jgi:hypothetical protein
MVDFDLYPGRILGIINVLFGIYCLIHLYQLRLTSLRSSPSVVTPARILRFIFSPLILITSGVFLFFTGWQFDPIAMFWQLLIDPAIMYLVFVDLKRFR